MPELIKGKCKWNVVGSVSNSQELETMKKICAARGINQHWLQGKRVSFFIPKNLSIFNKQQNGVQS
ncbi:hypothetical protein HJ060_22740 [Vibrio parahaemolyticus]|nr:hypothetical protein [Vibrio parahaemolyticus]MBE4345751.1 hypothetical protein [Vibrio parahaemolyticus]